MNSYEAWMSKIHIEAQEILRTEQQIEDSTDEHFIICFRTIATQLSQLTAIPYRDYCGEALELIFKGASPEGILNYFIHKMYRSKNTQESEGE